MKKLYHVILILLCLAWNANIARAQTTHATISGTVVDQSSNALVGATVVLKNESTGFTTGTQTNAQGDFLFKQLPLGGPYTVTASYIGSGIRCGESEIQLSREHSRCGDAVRKPVSVSGGIEIQFLN